MPSPPVPWSPTPTSRRRYRQDWARDPNAGRPVAVVRATCTADVQAVLRWASRHGVPVVPRGAGSGLSGGSTRGRGRHRAQPRADARGHDRRTHPRRRGPARRAERRGEASRCRRGTVVPAGSVLVRDVLDRRQRRHQRRRPVLRQVRRDHRLRARHAGRSGRRHGLAARRSAAEGRRRTVADQTVRGQRGDAGRDHRADPASGSGARRPRAPWSRRSRPSRRPPGRSWRSCPRCVRRCSN